MSTYYIISVAENGLKTRLVIGCQPLAENVVKRVLARFGAASVAVGPAPLRCPAEKARADAILTALYTGEHVKTPENTGVSALDRPGGTA